MLSCMELNNFTVHNGIFSPGFKTEGFIVNGFLYKEFIAFVRHMMERIAKKKRENECYIYVS